MVAIVLLLVLVVLVVVWSKIDRARLDIEQARREIDVLAVRLTDLERRSAPVSAAPTRRAPESTSRDRRGGDDPARTARPAR